MNCRFVGIELSDEYHKIATERHKQIAGGYNPFEKNAHIPRAKNSSGRRVVQQNYAVSKKNLQLDARRIAHELCHLP